MSEFRKRYDEIVRRYNSPERKAEEEKLKKKLQGHPIVLFGAAWIGDFVWDKLTTMGFPPTCFCDNYAVGLSPNGHSPIIKAKELVEKYSDAIVILTLDKAKNIVYSQLLELGFSEENIIKDAGDLIAPLTLEMFEQHLEGYEWAYNFFEDQKSKDIIMQRIACYLLGENVDKSESPQYFEKDIVKFGKNEVFADCGFFTGDTSEEFIKQTKGEYAHIYGFEPDEYVIKKAEKLINSTDKITHIPKGVYSSDTTLKFLSTFGTSAASGGNIVDQDAENVIEIQVTSLDAYFSDKEKKPTFIKMDIEGSEENALKGAKRIISEYKPKLAICVYHKPEDIYVLPKLIKKFNPEYKFYLCHYANYFWETVMYAL